MRSIFKLSIFITMAAILFGCSSSDSGSSTPPPPTTKSLNGVVIDPPVTGARVVLWGEIDGSYQPANFCGAGKNTICNTYTNNEGRFSIIYDLSKDISNFYLVTHGGTDTLYNTDLTGISLYSPLALFDVEKDIIVSPITTVVNSLIVNEGVSLSDAVQNTANALNISEDLVAVSPLESAELLKASYLVVKAAEFIHNESVEDPLTKIAAAVKEEPTLTIADDGFLNKLFELSDIT
ncbi:MAG: hypothetical protein LBP51_03165, partial [Deferribacteraceae bacterium]|nr:hypothetical protein [Deferribacteraceae bacterium]